MKQFLFVIIIFYFSSHLIAQDPTFSQFFNSRTYLNPATVAMEGGMTISSTYRNQWYQVSGKFETAYLSVEGLSCIGSAFGLYLLHDSEGEGLLQTLTAGFDYAYLIGSEGQFRLGLGSYWYQKRIDWNALVFSDQIDAKEGIRTGSFSQADRLYESKPSGMGFKAGFVYSSPTQKKYQASYSFGGGITHLGSLRLDGRTREGFYESTSIPLRFSFFGEVVLPYFRHQGKGFLLTFVPQIKYEQQSDLRVTNIGATMHYNSFSLGFFYQNTLPWGSYNNTDAMSVYFGSTHQWSANTLFELGVSYDTNSVPTFGGSNLGGYTGGVIEISLKLHFTSTGIFCGGGRPKMNSKNGGVNCPPAKRRHINEWYNNQKRKNLN